MWPVRSAEVSDWPAIQRFFKSLDQESRYMYFGFHASDLVIEQTWDRFHIQEHQFFVVELACNIIGVCQVAHRENHAELSVAVSRNHRQRGIAHALVERAVTWCKTHSIQDLMMFCLPDNNIIPKILKKHNLLPLMLSKPAEARFAVPEPECQDWQREQVNRVVDFWLTARQNWLKRIQSYIQPKSSV